MPNAEQEGMLSEWLVTLRKHRNYMLRERIEGYDGNNSAVEGEYSDLQTQGVSCPLTCPLRRHGVESAGLFKAKKKTGQVAYRTVGEVQSARTTELRSESRWYKQINSDVLQRNIARLDTAFKNFWEHGRGYPSFKNFATFKSFEYKPRQVKLLVNQRNSEKHRYSLACLPGIGDMRYFDSRPIPADAEQRTVTVIRKADGWYMSVLLVLPDELPELKPIESVKSLVGVDVGINQLASLSDGSFVENPRPATNRKTRRLMRIRQRRVNRKVKGSKNRAKAGKTVASLHNKIRNKRDAVGWHAAKKIVDTAEAITHEDLNITGMSKRCKLKKSENGRFLPNGQSAKRGLNRAILDAGWGTIFQKIGWLAMKAGRPVVQFRTPYSSQECPKCGHIDKSSRDGEKFVCTNCGHVDHADTKAARTGVSRTMQDYNLHFKPKKLRADCPKVTLSRYAAARKGKRQQAKNLIQLSLFDLTERMPNLERFGESPSL